MKKLIKTAILNYESAIVAKCKKNPKLIYDYINRQKSCRDQIKKLIGFDGIETTAKNDIANILNQQFVKVFTPETDKPIISPKSLEVKYIGSTDLNVLSETNVLKYINLLNEHKSIEHDGSHPLIIKKCSGIFAPVLSRIFTRSF